MSQYTTMILLLLFSFIISETEYDKFICNPSDAENIESGQTVTLCLHIPELKKRTVFKINVDEYTLVSIKDAYKNIIGGTDSTRRLVEEEGVVDQKQIIAQVGSTHTKYPSVSLKFLINDIIIFIKFF